MIKKTFFYIRKSTEDKKNQKYSHAYQKDALMQQFQGRFLDHEKVLLEVSESGVTPVEFSRNEVKKGRKHFGAMLLEIERILAKGGIVNLISFEFSRFARNEKDFMRLYDLRKKGLNIYTTTHVFLALPNDWDDPHFIEWSIAVMMARQEVMTTKKRQYGGIGKLKEAGKWGSRPPVGYKKGRDAGMLELDGKKAEGIREIFVKFAEEKLSILEFSKKYFDYFEVKYGVKIPRGTLGKILRCRLYIGEMTYEDKKYKTAFECILKTQKEKEIFEVVQEKLDGKRQKKKFKHSFIFRGKIKCKCGTSLIPEKQKGRIYYRCHKNSCDFKTIREEIIEKSLQTFFKSYKLSEKESKRIKKSLEKSLENIFAESEEKNKIQQKALLNIKQKEKTLVNMRINELISDEEFTEEKEVLQNKKVNLQENFKTDEMEDVYSIILKCLELLESGFIRWDTLTESNLLFLVDFIVSNFYITQKNALYIGVYEFLDFKKMLKCSDGG